MTELLIFLAVTDSAAPPGEWTFFGVPLAVVLPVLTVIGGVIGAVATQLTKKFRTPADEREDKVVVLDASDRLIQRFEALLAASDEKHAKEIKELSAKVDGLEKEVETMRSERDLMRRERFTMVAAIEKLIEIARRYGGQAADEEIRRVKVPADVTVP